MELKPAELLKEWKAGKFRPVYLIVGEEPAARAEAFAQLRALFNADSFNLVEFSGEPESEAAAVVAECSTLPVFAERRLVLVRGHKWGAAGKAALAEYLRDPLPSTTLGLQLEERRLDPKDALVGAALRAGAACLLGPLREDEARERLRAAAAQAGKTLTEEAAEALVAEAGTEWTVLKAELEKALLFAKDEKTLSEEAVLEVLGYQKAADPFALARLVSERKLREGLTQLRRWIGSGKKEDQAFRAVSQISGAVAKQLRAKRMKAAGLPEEQIKRALRLHPYWDRDYLKQVDRFTEPRLLRDARRCLETETDLKSKAWLDPAIELERLLVDLCRR